MTKLNALLQAATNKPAPGQGKILKARTISVTPQLDGFINLVPVLVESPFEIDTNPFTAKTSAVNRQGTMSIAGADSRRSDPHVREPLLTIRLPLGSGQRPVAVSVYRLCMTRPSREQPQLTTGRSLAR